MRIGSLVTCLTIVLISMYSCKDGSGLNTPNEFVTDSNGESTFESRDSLLSYYLKTVTRNRYSAIVLTYSPKFDMELLDHIYFANEPEYCSSDSMMTLILTDKDVDEIEVIVNTNVIRLVSILSDHKPSLCTICGFTSVYDSNHSLLNISEVFIDPYTLCDYTLSTLNKEK